MEIVGLLLKYGASPIIQSDDEVSLLTIASDKGYYHGVVAYLLRDGDLTLGRDAAQRAWVLHRCTYIVSFRKPILGQVRPSGTKLSR